MASTPSTDNVNAWLSIIGLPGAKVATKSGLLIVSEYVGGRQVQAAKEAGFRSTSCNKFGKVWSTSVRLADVTDWEAQEIDGVTNDRG